MVTLYCLMVMLYCLMVMMLQLGNGWDCLQKVQVGGLKFPAINDAGLLFPLNRSVLSFVPWSSDRLGLIRLAFSSF